MQQRGSHSRVCGHTSCSPDMTSRAQVHPSSQEAADTGTTSWKLEPAASRNGTQLLRTSCFHMQAYSSYNYSNSTWGRCDQSRTGNRNTCCSAEAADRSTAKAVPLHLAAALAKLPTSCAAPTAVAADKVQPANLMAATTDNLLEQRMPVRQGPAAAAAAVASASSPFISSTRRSTP